LSKLSVCFDVGTMAENVFIL